jgi:regulatory protein
MPEKNKPQILKYAYNYLSYRPRSEVEMINYLKEKQQKYHWQDEEIEEIMEELKGGKDCEETISIFPKLIDDHAFVQWFVEARSAKKYKSEKAIKNDLRKYFISQEIVDKYFSKNLLDEEDHAYQLLKKKWSRYAKEDKNKRFQKAANFLAQKGYSYSIIKKTIAIFENER